MFYHQWMINKLGVLGFELRVMNLKEKSQVRIKMSVKTKFLNYKFALDFSDNLSHWQIP